MRNQTNCGGRDTIQAYGGLRCNLEGILYPGPERVYSIVLEEDNAFGVTLDSEGSEADLMLALVRDCGDGSRCEAASVDHIGPGSEEIPTLSREAGLYYLYVDSFFPANDGRSCGDYTLTVTGHGVRPSVDLELSQHANQDPVTAGSGTGNLVLTVRVTNQGPNDATDITVVSELDPLPAGVRLEEVEPDRGMFQESVWGIDRLDVGQSATLSLTLTVGPSALPGEIRHTATVTGAEQFRLNSGDDSSTRRVSIRRQVSLDASFPPPPPTEAVAGENFDVTAQWHNDGPSDASGVAARLQLPPGFTVRSADCDFVRETPTGARVDLGELPAGERRQCQFTVHVDSSVREGTPRLRTEVESQVPPATASRQVALTVHREVSLEASFPEPPPAEPVAGESFDITARWSNGGPSDASRVVATLRLGSGLTLDRARCDSAPETPTSTQVGLGELPAGADEERQFPVYVCPSARGTRTLQTVVNSQEPAATASAEVALTVIGVTELELNVDATPDPATAGDKLIYTITITNHGPSDATNVVLTDTLPDGVTPAPVDDPCEINDNSVVCNLGVLPAESTKEGGILVFVNPSTRGVLINEATVASEENEDGDSDSRSTTVTADVIFQPTKAAWPDPVAPGDLLFYRLEALNGGPSDALEPQVTDRLPLEVDFVAASPGCSLGDAPQGDEPQEVICDLDPSGGMDGLTVDATARRGVVVRVEGLPQAEDSITNTATFENLETVPDPQPESAQAVTEVREGTNDSVLLLPFAHFDPMAWTTTYLALQRLAPDTAEPGQEPMPLPVEIELFNPDGEEAFCVLEEELSQDQVILLDLAAAIEAEIARADEDDTVRCEPPGMDGVGFAQIHFTGNEMDGMRFRRSTTEALHGAFFEVDAAVGRAIGSTLVRSRSGLYTDSVKSLPDLCPYWDHQVMVEDGWDTKIRFYLPEPMEEQHKSYEVQGTFYDATGQPTARIPLSIPGRVAELDIATLRIPDGTDISDGTVEWDLGTVGHVSVVYQGADPALTVGMPAFCQTLVSFADTAGGPPFVVPSFAVAEGEGDGAQETTLLSLHNGTDLPVEVNVAVQGPDESPALPAPDDSPSLATPDAEWFPLAPHATWTRDLLDLLTPPDGQEPERREGYVAITAREPESGAVTDATQILDGEILHLSDARASASGERLVTSPGDLCRRWALFLIQNHPADPENLFNEGTEYVFYLPAIPDPDPDPAMVEVTVYDQEGHCVLDNCEAVPISIPGYSFRVSAGDILDRLPDDALEDELTLGAVEIAFPEGAVGNVSSVFSSSAGYAVETRGSCLEP